MLFLNWLRWFERVFLVGTFLLMVVLFFLNVVFRELGGSLASELTWIEEAVRLMNLFLVFGALGLALERGKHVGIDTFRDRLHGPVRFFLLKGIDLVGLLFSAYLAWQGLGLAKFVLSTGQTSPTLGISMGWIYMAPVFGFSLLGLRYLLSLAGVIDRFGTGQDEEEAKC